MYKLMVTEVLQLAVGVAVSQMRVVSDEVVA